MTSPVCLLVWLIASLLASLADSKSVKLVDLYIYILFFFETEVLVPFCENPLSGFMELFVPDFRKISVPIFKASKSLV